jgi:hypothetical protein
MWLIDRGTDGLGPRRIPLPEPVREALVRWYAGEGSRADEEAGIVLVQQARIGGRWIACDCLPADAPPPILTPAFLSEAETYYLRRLTSSGRPEHHGQCPFFREAATNRLSEVRGRHSAADPPHGYFEALRPAPEKLAQKPEEQGIDDRTRQASVPRLARLLWRLIDLAGVNRCPPLRLDDGRSSIGEQFRALVAATGRVEIAPGLELARAFWTHAQALHSRRVFASLRALARQWPRGHAPQAFLALYAHKVRGATIHVAGAAPVVLANRVQSPSIRDNRIEGPYLVLVVIGEYPEAHGYAPLRGYAQPILSGRRFIPIESDFEREVLRALINLRTPLDRRGAEIHIEKPVFDLLTPLGPCRPDILVEARSRLTGECRQIAVRITDGPAESAAETLSRLRLIAPVLEVSTLDMRPGRLERRLFEALDL